MKIKYRPKRFFNGFLINNPLLGLGTGSQIIGDQRMKTSKPALQELFTQFHHGENNVDDTEQQNFFGAIKACLQLR